VRLLDDDGCVAIDRIYGLVDVTVMKFVESSFRIEHVLVSVDVAPVHKGLHGIASGGTPPSPSKDPPRSPPICRLACRSQQVWLIHACTSVGD
jgi:hypothetical protein